ncbi:hypothetical protein ASF48_04920 [Rathayibacter sp. Leaf299]|uniref:hypothetical protein n=1 Tax=Rathayibacter sp. Leaf299 TaxID=1736328 RepID=UPI0006F21A17|nr:hypothetical protein [Rathayibacter sp. Leaf299]KQQ22528.1 hypothetical protein ASF48_04920 [Rathayibacter sp. Leaf299]
MAGPAGRGGKSVGRVTIRVVPDATRFREDLKKTLERIEKNNILKIDVDANMRPAERTIKRFIDRWSGEEIHLSVDVNGASLSNARIAQAARPRVVPLNLEVTKASIAKVGAAIAALSGGRMFTDLGKRLGEGILNLDRSLPRMAAMVSGIASLAAAAIAAAGGLATLAASLSSILAISALAPALIAGAGVSIAVLMVALSQVGDRLDDLIPLWDRLKTRIGDNFWGEAEAPIRRLVKDLFPSMLEGLGRTSTALGQWTASLADGFRTALTGERVGRMFDRLVESIDIAAGGTDSFASALVNLGLVGSDYLPRLAQWIANLTERFDNFVGAAAADGRLKGWIDAGIESAKLLGSVLADTVRIIAAISRAATAAGGDGLATMASGLSRAADALSAPAFQTGLTGLFRGANAALDGVNGGLARFGQMLADRSADLSTFLAVGGQAFGELLGGVSDLLNQPAVGQGLLLFIAGLRDGIISLFENLDPAAFGEFVRSLGALAGTLAVELGETLGKGLTELLPLITQLLDDISARLPDLAAALQEILEKLPAALDSLIEKGPAALDLIVGLVDAVALLSSLIGPLADFLAPVVQKFGEAGAAASALTDFFNGNSASVEQLGGKMTGFNGTMITLISTIATVAAPALRVLANLVDIARDAFTSAATAIAAFARDGIAAIARFVAQVGAAWTAFWSTFSQKPVAAGARLVGDLIGAMGNLSGALVGVGAALIGGLIAGIQSAAGRAVAAAVAVVRNALAAAQSVVGGGGGPAKGVGSPPDMATGGTILPTPGGTIVRVAEAGKPESIVDTGAVNRMITETNSRLSQQSAGPMTVLVQSPWGDGEYFEARVESISRSTTAQSTRRAKALVTSRRG